MTEVFTAQGAVVWVDLDPSVGSEQAGRRPAVVVSSGLYNSVIPNVIMVVPVTTRDRGLPNHVRLSGGDLALDRVSFAMTEQLRTVDRRRIKGVAGSVDVETVAEILKWLSDHLGTRL